MNEHFSGFLCLFTGARINNTDREFRKLIKNSVVWSIDSIHAGNYYLYNTYVHRYNA